MSASAPDAAAEHGTMAAARVDAVAARLALALPLVFIPAHAVAALTSSNPIGASTLLCETLAAFIAALACGLRGQNSGGRERLGWLVIAMAMLCWSAGVGWQLLGALTPAGASGTGAISMLLFVLYGVPLVFLLASPNEDPWPVRVVDGALAMVLGALFGAFIFSFVQLSGVSDTAGEMTLSLMFDIQNIFIAVFALIRHRASTNEQDRRFFGALTAFAWAYMIGAAYYNHFVGEEAGGLVSLSVGAPFILLAVLALRRPGAARVLPKSSMFARVVHTGSPLILPVSLLILSAALVPSLPALAIAGCVAATLGYGVRAVLVQLHGMRERDRLAQLSQIDALTGLPNRRQFDEALRRELVRADRGGQGLALLMIDIDHFKLLNDTLGHQAGDERLRDVAEALQACATRATDVVARYGGEEFAAILPGASPAEALVVAEAMRASVEARALTSPAPDGRVTVSIGAARLTEIDSDAGQRLIERADAALYDSKRTGRNRVTAAWPVDESVRAVIR
ncbi:GGDEF domain-containing protein [Sphingomonas koreensis]